MIIPGGLELFVIVGIIVLLFGASMIPKLAWAIGQAEGEFDLARQEYKDKDEP